MDNDLISRRKAIIALANADAEKGWKRLKFSEMQKCLLDLPSEESEQTWIEIYEGQKNLPPLGMDVLLCTINGNMDVGYLTKDEEGLKWKVGTWYNDFLEWDAWKYLPEPWKGEKK